MTNKPSKWQQIKAIFGTPADSPPAYETVISNATADFALAQDEWQSWVDEAYAHNDLVCKGLNLIADAVVEAPIAVEGADGEVLDKDPGHMLINHVNDNMTPRDFLRKLILQMYIGNQAYIQKVRTKSGKVTELGLLRPDKVEIVYPNKGSPAYYTYNPGSINKKIVIPYSDIIVIRFTDVSSQFRGYSPLKSLYAYIDTSNELIKHVKSVLQNGGVPNAVITVSKDAPLGKDQADALAKSFMQKFSGEGKGKTAVMHGGMELSTFGFDFSQLNITELSNFVEARILAGMGIPLPVYGALTGSIASTYENLKVSGKMFWKQTIIPLQTMIEDALNHDGDLLPILSYTRGDRFKFDRSDVEALQEDINAASARADSSYTQGVITLNEARAAQGYEPLDDGDKLKPAPQPLWSLPPVEDTTTDEIKSGCCHGRERVCCQKASEKGSETLQGGEGASHPEVSPESSKALKDDRLSKDFAIASKRLAKADKQAIPLVRMISKTFDSQINDVLDIINQKFDTLGEVETKSDSQTILTQLKSLVKKWTEELNEDALPILGDLVQESAKDAALSIGASFSIADETVQQAIKSQVLKFADQVSATSGTKIQAILSEAFTAGDSLATISGKISDLGETWQGARADMVARTETVRAANGGAKIGYKAAGVTKLRWSAVLDDATSDICQELDGKVVGIDAPFLTDEDGTGYDLSYEGGSMENPPAHPNCRSTVIAEIQD